MQKVNQGLGSMKELMPVLCSVNLQQTFHIMYLNLLKACHND